MNLITSVMAFAWVVGVNTPNPAIFRNYMQLNNCSIVDYYYNDVLNDIVFNCDLFGDLYLDDDNVFNFSSVSDNSLGVSLRFDCDEPEETFVAMRDLLMQRSLEQYGTNEYALSCWDRLECYFEYNYYSFSSNGFIDINFTLYIDIGINEQYFSFSFANLLDMHYEIDSNSIQSFDEIFIRPYSLGLVYVDETTSSISLNNNSEYYYELVEDNKEHWEEQGRINGYEQGYQEGVNSTPFGVLELVTKPFVEMGKFLNIQIAPNLTLGMIISIPIIVAVIGFLIKALIA